MLDLLAGMTAASIEASSLDPETLMLVRIAALVAVDAAPPRTSPTSTPSSDLEIDPDRFAACSPQSLRSWERHASSRRSARSLEALELELEAAEIGRRRARSMSGGPEGGLRPSVADKEGRTETKEEPWK